ncbi:MAG: hypothetical protein IJO21_03230 [Oscillospiraceae bacterium]|nr:hypothetical protein [Oscillospiraceae bacterium]MBQ7130040.1 hypothetical protein [Oscillospiraceae bacterium]
MQIDVYSQDTPPASFCQQKTGAGDGYFTKRKQNGRFCFLKTIIAEAIMINVHEKAIYLDQLSEKKMHRLPSVHFLFCYR